MFIFLRFLFLQMFFFFCFFFCQSPPSLTHSLKTSEQCLNSWQPSSALNSWYEEYRLMFGRALEAWSFRHCWLSQTSTIGACFRFNRMCLYRERGQHRVSKLLSRATLSGPHPLIYRRGKTQLCPHINEHTPAFPTSTNMLPYAPISTHLPRTQP